VHFIEVSGSDGVSHGSAIVAIDSHGPVITVNAPSGTYSLNQVVPASYRCTDPGSGTASCTGTLPNGANIDTSTVGTHTFVVNATDIAGNSSTRTISYGVGYRFDGFFQPVDASPTLNLAKAGSSIPLKWNLKDASGAYIRNLAVVTSVESQRIPCASTAPLDTIEQTLAVGSPALQYDVTNEQYIFAWKTLKTWAGTCLRLTLLLNDGTAHVADFKFN
jgi:hypothetical protein